jgi:hypothetical protein
MRTLKIYGIEVTAVFTQDGWYQIPEDTTATAIEVDGAPIA